MYWMIIDIPPAVRMDHCQRELNRQEWSPMSNCTRAGKMFHTFSNFQPGRDRNREMIRLNRKKNQLMDTTIQFWI